MTFDELQIPLEIQAWIMPIASILIGIALSAWVIYLGSLWLIYVKAGRSGWLIFIPIINIYVLLRIAGQPGWYLLLLFIPLVNLFVIILMWLGLAKAFGKSGLFGLGLIFFNWIFLVGLAFGQSEYQLLDTRKGHVDEFQAINVRPS